MRKAEAKKVRQSTTVVRDEASHVEHRRLIETLQRKSALIQAGVWPLPEGWDADLTSPDYVPMLTPDDDAEPPKDLAEALRNARLAHLRKISAKSS